MGGRCKELSARLCACRPAPPLATRWARCVWAAGGEQGGGAARARWPLLQTSDRRRASGGWIPFFFLSFFSSFFFLTPCALPARKGWVATRPLRPALAPSARTGDGAGRGARRLVIFSLFSSPSRPVAWVVRGCGAGVWGAVPPWPAPPVAGAVRSPLGYCTVLYLCFTVHSTLQCAVPLEA